MENDISKEKDIGKENEMSKENDIGAGEDKHNKKEVTSKSVMDMTKGNPTKLLLRFAVPLLIGNVFQQVYNLVDAAVIGHWGNEAALAAVGMSGPLYFLLQSFVIGMSIGVGIVVSQYYGAGDEKMVKKTIGNSWYPVYISAIIMSLIGFFGVRTIVGLIDVTPEAEPYAVTYISVTSLGIVLVATFNLASSILRALGDSKTPIMFLIVSCIINTILDLIFVIRLGMGVFGVALATVIAQTLAAAFCLTYAYMSNEYFRIKKSDLKFDAILQKKIIRVGIPVGVQNAFIAFSLVILQKVVNGFGTTFMAGFTTVGKIEQLIQQPFMSTGAALATYTGQNMGIGDTERVKKGFVAATKITTAFALAILVIFHAFAPWIVMIIGGSEDSMAIGVEGIRITSCFYFFLGLIYTTRNVLNGSGDAWFSMFTGIIEVFCRIGFAVLLTRISWIGAMGVWFATGLTWFFNGTISSIRYKTGGWKNKSVIRTRDVNSY